MSICPVCNKTMKKGFLNSDVVTIQDAQICIHCHSEWDRIANLNGRHLSELSMKELKAHMKTRYNPTLSEVMSVMNSKIQKSNVFKSTHTVNGFVDFDDVNRIAFIRGGLHFTGKPMEFEPTYVSYDDIIGCEVLNGNTVVMSATTGSAGHHTSYPASNFGKPIVVMSIAVFVITSDPNHPRIEIPISRKALKTSDPQYILSMDQCRAIMNQFSEILKKRGGTGCPEVSMFTDHYD